MSEAAKHTPTPWHAVENSWSNTGIYAGHKEVASLDIYDEATEDDQGEHEVRMAANAAFIVKAANSHDQLVAALRKIAAGDYAQADLVALEALEAAGLV